MPEWAPRDLGHYDITAPIAQWLERTDQEAGGPGFDPHLVELSGLWVRPFKVSGGSPRPTPEQTPVVKVKTPRVSKQNKKQQKHDIIL